MLIYAGLESADSEWKVTKASGGTACEAGYSALRSSKTPPEQLRHEQQGLLHPRLSCRAVPFQVLTAVQPHEEGSQLVVNMSRLQPCGTSQ